MTHPSYRGLTSLPAWPATAWRRGTRVSIFPVTVGKKRLYPGPQCFRFCLAVRKVSERTSILRRHKAERIRNRVKNEVGAELRGQSRHPAPSKKHARIAR